VTDHRNERPRIERRVVGGRTVWVERDRSGIVELSESRDAVESDAEARRAAR
jgi:hypothetical protein